MAKSKFEIYKDKSGQFRWRLIASNGEAVATGESHSEKRAAMNAVKKLKVWSNTDIIIDREAEKEAAKKAPVKKAGKPEAKAPVKKAVKKVAKVAKKAAPAPTTEKTIL